MTTDDNLQKNIQRTTAAHALKQIRNIVDEENANEANKTRLLGLMVRYGWIILLVIAILLARLLGVI
ncbi:MAG: hypothetical protein AAB278_01470 [Pseudomonadota bacterium]